MASNYLIFLVTLVLIGTSSQSTSDNTVDDDSNPIADAISEVLKKQNTENIGALVQNFLQEQGGNIIGDALSNLGKQNAGALLQGLGSMLANQGNNEKDGKGSSGSLLKEGNIDRLIFRRR